MEVSREDLEWICEQLECLEDWATNIDEEAYACRKVIKKWLNDNGTTGKSRKTK